VQQVALGELIEIASQVLAVDRATARSMMNIPLAESALGAPFAGFGDFERYPTFNEKVGVLGYRIARNHVLTDGNKRTALLAMIEFVERNGHLFDDADQDDIGDVMEAAAEGSVSELGFIAWVGEHIKTPSHR